MHLHVHTLYLNHIGNLAAGILPLTTYAQSLDPANRSLTHFVLELHGLWGLSVGLHIVLEIIEDAVEVH